MRTRSIEQSVKDRIIEYITPRAGLMQCQVRPNDSDQDAQHPSLTVSCERVQERVQGSAIWQLSVTLTARVNYLLEEGAPRKASLDSIFSAAESMMLHRDSALALSTPLLRVYGIVTDQPLEEGIDGNVRYRSMQLTMYASLMGNPWQ